MPRRPTGWSKRKRATFLEVLRTTGNISAAARAIGMARASLYDLRRQDDTFHREWDSALEESLDDLEGELRRRALQGTEKPVYYGGKQCGAIQSFNDNLGMFLLKGRRGNVYAKDKPGAGKENDPASHQAKSPREKLLAKLNKMASKPKT